MKIFCCYLFDNARKSGTDNEGHGKLIHRFNGKYFIGCDLQPMVYCPWCGFEIEEIE